MAFDPADDTDGATYADRTDMMRTRTALLAAMGLAYQGNRDYYQNFGWTRSPDIEDYYATFLRNPWAKPVLAKPATTSWRDPPTIVDRQDTAGDDETPFESDIGQFVRATDCWHYGKRADLLSGLGKFGVLMIGWADGDEQPFATPVDQTAVASNDASDAVEWFRPFSQLSVESIRYGQSGARLGEPEYYRLDFGDENDAVTDDVFGQFDSDQWVHRSRILHVPSWANGVGRLDDEVRGTPRLESSYNVLVDIQKTLGSAAESAFSIARPGLHVNVNEGYDVDDGGQKLGQELDRYVNEQQPFMRTQGTDVNRIDGETVDPTNIADAQIEALSAASGQPQKVLRGNESGEVAGSQDLREWYGTIQERREQFVAPVLVRELVQRLIDYGAITPPSGSGFDVDWPALAEQDEKEQSEIRLNRSKAAKNLATAVPGYGSEEWIEYVETGEFPEPQTAGEIAPMSPAENAGAPPES
jgi:hypothetical protein